MISIFEKLSIRQILVFTEIAAESSLRNIEFVREKYLENALNFDETVEFLRDLGLIEVRGDHILLKPTYKVFLERFIASNKKGQILNNFIIELLIYRTNRFSEYLAEFIGNFHFKKGQYEYMPTAPQRLAYSGLRNYLMDLEFLYLDSSGVKYVIPDYHYSRAYTEIVGHHGLSPEEVLYLEQKNREIGVGAELQVIEYEKQRLEYFPLLAAKIEHVSIKDAAAGYDVRSFEAIEQEKPVPRLIEVKAVSLWDYRFNWTRKEIQISRLNAGTYYLYLLPVVGKNSFGLEYIRIIENPYANVYKNSNEWARDYEVVSFRDRSKEGKVWSARK